ncbi:MAG: N-6 DNA methylase, partial [Desulfobacterales bacterium]|nr:N-6 DNA methylase [Desulfobacterales bacterium]
TDDFANLRFDFMLSNPPYGKSWKTDRKIIMDGKEVIDSRFEVTLRDFRGVEAAAPATPRSSDGQLLFLMEMVNKMKGAGGRAPGARIASVHNGSSLFTGDAGSGESNIRRHIIENDWLEAIIQLPNNMFYNTGITTYIWVVSNKKTKSRKGKVQLIDASGLFRKLRKNLGAKNCEFAPEHTARITALYLDMPDDGVSKVFHNHDFGYYKVTIERPNRLAAQFTPARVASLRFAPALREEMAWIYEKYGDAVYKDPARHRKAIETHLEKEEINLNARKRKMLFSRKPWDDQKKLMETAEVLMKEVGRARHKDFNLFKAKVEKALKKNSLKLSPPEKNQILGAMSRRDEKAKRVIKKVHKLKGKKRTQLLKDLGCKKGDLRDFGYWPGKKAGEYIEYEPDSALRDNENIPLKEGVHAYFQREVRPHVDDAWINIDQTKIGYEISFNKYFYKHKPLRSLQEVTADILALEKETEGLLKKLVNPGGIR